MKYRRRPFPVEAIQLTWQNWNAVCDFVPDSMFVRGVWLDKNGEVLPVNDYRFTDDNSNMGLLVRTVSGRLKLIPGDYWIIKDIAGQLDMCSAELFEQAYEPDESKS
jgi:hypothetical protein